MKKVIIVVILLGVIFILYGKINRKYESFKATVVSILPKIDGTGYALVLRSADPARPHEWESAEVTGRVSEGDTVIVERWHNRVLYNGSNKGTLLGNKWTKIADALKN